MFATTDPRHDAVTATQPEDRAAEDAGSHGTEDAPSAEVAAELVGRLFPEVYRRFHAGARLRYGADLPVTARSVQVLTHLGAAGPMTVGEQAAHLGLRRNSVSELLQRLEAKGLVGRIRDERDGRRVLVWLTDPGRDLVSRVGRVLAPDLLVETLGRLDPEERRAVVRGFQLLAEDHEHARDDR